MSLIGTPESLGVAFDAIGFRFSPCFSSGLNLGNSLSEIVFSILRWHDLLFGCIPSIRSFLLLLMYGDCSGVRGNCFFFSGDSFLHLTLSALPGDTQVWGRLLFVADGDKGGESREI